MALDYKSMRDATQMATAMELAKAQNIGQSAASLGHAGGLGWDAMGGGQGLMNFLKGRINPFTQESIEDPNRVYEQPSGAYDGSSQEMDSIVNKFTPNFMRGNYEGSSEETPGAVQGLLNAIGTNKPQKTSILSGAVIPDNGQSNSMLERYQEILEEQKLQDTGFMSDEMLYGPNNMVTDRPGVSPPVGETFGSVDDYGNVESLPGMGTTNQTQPTNVGQDYMSSGPDFLPANMMDQRNQALGNMGATKDSMLGLIQNQQPSPINANQMDTQFGKGFSNLQPDFRMAFRNTGGAKLPNKYSTDPKVLEFLENKGIKPWDIIWE